MNKLQSVELEIVKSFIKICEELNLKYFFVCGSALGAIKYKGFIPWDDDIDIGMPRKDYEIFCERAQSMLPDYYFVQNYKTDKAFPAIYSKIRDSRTTFIERSVSHLNINHGIYIDVFPLDGYPLEKSDIYALERKKSLLKLLLLCAYKPSDKYSLKTKIFCRVEKILGIHKMTNRLVEKLEKTISVWNIDSSNKICNHGNWQGVLEYAPKWHYGDGAWVEFEGLKVRVPEKYDDYLTQKYGDWKKDLPKELQVGHHYYEMIDFQKSYREHIERISKDGMHISLKSKMKCN